MRGGINAGLCWYRTHTHALSLSLSASVIMLREEWRKIYKFDLYFCAVGRTVGTTDKNICDIFRKNFCLLSVRGVYGACKIAG